MADHSCRIVASAETRCTTIATMCQLREYTSYESRHVLLKE